MTSFSLLWLGGQRPLRSSLLLHMRACEASMGLPCGRLVASIIIRAHRAINEFAIFSLREPPRSFPFEPRPPLSEQRCGENCNLIPKFGL